MVEKNESIVILVLNIINTPHNPFESHSQVILSQNLRSTEEGNTNILRGRLRNFFELKSNSQHATTSSVVAAYLFSQTLPMNTRSSSPDKRRGGGRLPPLPTKAEEGNRRRKEEGISEAGQSIKKSSC